MPHLLFALTLIAAPMAASADELVIYLHNAWYEMHKDKTPHPKHGVYQIDAIHAALAEGVNFRAPTRGPGSDLASAAQDVVQLVREEIASGRPASSIKVIGASKGSLIAMLASAELAEPDVRWVLIGGCNPKRLAARSPRLTGRVLSIYEASDTVGQSCPAGTDFTAATTAFEEVRTDTGLGHGFLFRADPAWVDPARAW